MLSPDDIKCIKEQAFLGVSSNLERVCKVRPLAIKEIIAMSRKAYEAKVSLLLLKEVDIAKIIKEKTGNEPKIEDIHVLEYLLQSAANDDVFLLELQQAFSTFIEEEIILLPKINSILVGNPKEKRLITEKNFSTFQEILSIQNCRTVKESPPENESAIARKYRLLAEKREEVKKKQKQKVQGGDNFLETIEVADAFGIDYQNCTLFALSKKLTRYQLKEKWNQDLQMIMAGADGKKIKAKYWGESQEK